LHWRRLCRVFIVVYRCCFVIVWVIILLDSLCFGCCYLWFRSLSK
jgi:hypothetical protein